MKGHPYATQGEADLLFYLRGRLLWICLAVVGCIAVCNFIGLKAQRVSFNVKGVQARKASTSAPLASALPVNEKGQSLQY